jgi:uncharacterized membrane protein YdjX (TVP38/TMEM64 family)
MNLRRFWLVAAGTALAMLALYGVFELLGWNRQLTHPTPDARAPFAAVGVLLLIADVLIPVPSSVVMLGNGALFGVAAGTALSLVGATGATWFGHWIGSAASGPFSRLLHEDELERARALLKRWGMTAVALSRPVPILAETVAIVAGAAQFGRSRTVLAGAIGSLPGAALYAWAGARGLDSASDAAVFGVVIAISAAFWFIGRRDHTRSRP